MVTPLYPLHISTRHYRCTPVPTQWLIPTFRAARQKRVGDGVVEPVEHRDHAVESVVGEVSGRVHRRHEHLDEQVLLLAGYGVASPEWGGKGGSARVGDMEEEQEGKRRGGGIEGGRVHTSI